MHAEGQNRPGVFSLRAHLSFDLRSANGLLCCCRGRFWPRWMKFCLPVTALSVLGPALPIASAIRHPACGWALNIHSTTAGSFSCAVRAETLACQSRSLNHLEAAAT